jgi:hypothetical protein
MNARYLEKNGFGLFAKSLDDPQTVMRFLERLPAFEEKLAAYAQDGNEVLYRTLDGVLDRAAAGVL